MVERELGGRNLLGFDFYRGAEKPQTLKCTLHAGRMVFCLLSAPMFERLRLLSLTPTWWCLLYWLY